MDAAPKSSRRRAWWIVLGVVGFIFLAVGAVFVEAWISAGRTLEREYQTVADRVEKLRTRSVQLVNFFEPPVEGDGRAILEESDKILDSFEVGAFDVFPSLAGDEIPKIDDAAIAAMLQKLQPALELLRRSLACRRFESFRNHDGMLAEPLPYISAVIKWNRILTDLAAHKHRAGDERGAFEFLAMGMWVGYAPTPNGVVLHELVRFVTDGIQCHTLRKLLEDHGASARDLEWLGRVLDRLRAEQSSLLEVMVRDDIAYRQALLKVYREPKDQKALEEMQALFGGRQEKGYWKYMPRRILIAKALQWHDWSLKSQERISKSQIKDRYFTAKKEAELMPGSAFLLVGGYLPRLWHNWVIDVQVMTMARLSLAVAEFEARNGRYPATLQDLVPSLLPAVPRDPWNGLPFRYANLNTSAQVISLGPDGDDDGGRAPPDDDDLEADGDVVWTIKRRTEVKK